MPAHDGVGKASLPAFNAEGGSFTVYFRCRGHGNAVLTGKSIKSVSMECDEALTKLTVDDEPSTHRLKLAAGADVRWSIAVTDPRE